MWLHRKVPKSRSPNILVLSWQAMTKPEKTYAVCLVAFCSLLILRALLFPIQKDPAAIVMKHARRTPEEEWLAMAPPNIPDKSDNAGRKVFILPGSDNRCMWQFNYFCRFFFYVRCYVYGAFPNVKVADKVENVASEVKHGDIVVVVWRSKNHSVIPPDLVYLTKWRTSGGAALRKKRAAVRIGVMHIANEKERQNWPWYTLADFVVRNYWMKALPAHSTYIPLGHQMPSICTPETSHAMDILTQRPEDSTTICSCGGVGLKRASDRQFMWSFSGSVRKRRGQLLKHLRQSSTLKDRGFIHVSKRFGGDGAYGEKYNNPKTAHLALIMESQFVFAPCGNVMETHRIYEALALGAIPVIENCDPEGSAFFPFRQLLISDGPEGMVQFVEQYLNRPHRIDHLQHQILVWWRQYSTQVTQNVSRTLLTKVSPRDIIAP